MNNPKLIELIAKTSFREETFFEACSLITKRNLKTMIETGTTRSGENGFETEGCSTLIFSLLAEELNHDFHSIDISFLNLSKAKNFTESYTKKTKFYHCDSIFFLLNYKKPIDFLYLDSLDYNVSNPLPSQYHHLNEIAVAYDKLSKGAVVMIDDCNLVNGGKGKFVIEFLLKKNWKILKKSYQVILSRIK